MEMHQRWRFQLLTKEKCERRRRLPGGRQGMTAMFHTINLIDISGCSIDISIVFNIYFSSVVSTVRAQETLKSHFKASYLFKLS